MRDARVHPEPRLGSSEKGSGCGLSPQDTLRAALGFAGRRWTWAGAASAHALSARIRQSLASSRRPVQCLRSPRPLPAGWGWAGGSKLSLSAQPPALHELQGDSQVSEAQVSGSSAGGHGCEQRMLPVPLLRAPLGLGARSQGQGPEVLIVTPRPLLSHRPTAAARATEPPRTRATSWTTPPCPSTRRCWASAPWAWPAWGSAPRRPSPGPPGRRPPRCTTTSSARWARGCAGRAGRTAPPLEKS